MARGNQPEAEASTGTADAGEAKADSRLIMLNVPTGHPVTSLGANPLNSAEQLALAAGSHPRNAVIRALAKTGEWTRGDIAKEITKLQFPNGGGKVAYQIVFQATRGITNVKAAQRGEKPAEGGAVAESAPVEAPPEEVTAE